MTTTRHTNTTRAFLEALAIADYTAAAGTVITVDCIMGYNENGDSCAINCDPPISVRVDVGQQFNAGILHWNDNYLDPYWDVTPVDPSDPRIAGLRSFYADGPSHIWQPAVCSTTTETTHTITVLTDDSSGGIFVRFEGSDLLIAGSGESGHVVDLPFAVRLGQALLDTPGIRTRYRTVDPVTPPNHTLAYASLYGDLNPAAFREWFIDNELEEHPELDADAGRALALDIFNSQHWPVFLCNGCGSRHLVEDEPPCECVSASPAAVRQIEKLSQKPDFSVATREEANAWADTDGIGAIESAHRRRLVDEAYPEADDDDDEANEFCIVAGCFQQPQPDSNLCIACTDGYCEHGTPLDNPCDACRDEDECACGQDDCELCNSSLATNNAFLAAYNKTGGAE